MFGCRRHPRQPPSFLVMPLRNKIRQREFVCYRQLLSLPLSWCVRWCRGLPDGRQPLFFFKPEFFESPQTIRGEMRYLAWRLIIAPNFSKCFRSCDVIAAPDDLERAFAQFIREKVEAVLVPLDSTRPSVPTEAYRDCRASTLGRQLWLILGKQMIDHNQPHNK